MPEEHWLEFVSSRSCSFYCNSPFRMVVCFLLNSKRRCGWWMKWYFIFACRSGCCVALFLTPTAVYGAEVGCGPGHSQHSCCVPFLSHTSFGTAVCRGVSGSRASRRRGQRVDRWAWVWGHAEAGVKGRSGQGCLCWNNQSKDRCWLDKNACLFFNSIILIWVRCLCSS